MSDQLHIVIPTKSRPDSVLTNISGQILVVDESEKDLYHQENKIICPNFSSLAKKRNWIIETFCDVFMVDDDIVSCQRLYEHEYKTFNLTPDEQRKIIENAYFQAKEIGAFLFGFNNDPAPVHFNAMKPFMLNGYINGSAIGIISGGKLRFSEKITAAESHYINLLNSHLNRFNFIDKRFCFKQEKDSTFKKNGGQQLNRTLETEKRDTLFLRLIFGEAVQLKKKKNKTLQIHEYQRQIKQKI